MLRIYLGPSYQKSCAVSQVASCRVCLCILDSYTIDHDSSSEILPSIPISSFLNLEGTPSYLPRDLRKGDFRFWSRVAHFEQTIEQRASLTTATTPHFIILAVILPLFLRRRLQKLSLTSNKHAEGSIDGPVSNGRARATRREIIWNTRHAAVAHYMHKYERRQEFHS